MQVKQIKPIEAKPPKLGKPVKLMVSKVKIPKMKNFTIKPSRLKEAAK